MVLASDERLQSLDLPSTIIGDMHAKLAALRLGGPACMHPPGLGVVAGNPVAIVLDDGHQRRAVDPKEVQLDVGGQLSVKTGEDSQQPVGTTRGTATD